MVLWVRLIVVGVVMLVTIVVARLIDRRIARRDLPPGAITRYRVLRRSVTADDHLRRAARRRCS